MYAVRFVVRHQVVELVTDCMFGNVFEVREELVVHTWEEVQCCLVENIPRHYPSGEVGDRVPASLLPECCCSTSCLVLRQAELLIVRTLSYCGHVEVVW